MGAPSPKGGLPVAAPVDLSAALNLLEGPVMAGYDPPPRQKEFLASMNVLNRGVPSELRIHLVPDYLGVPRRG